MTRAIFRVIIRTILIISCFISIGYMFYFMNELSERTMKEYDARPTYYYNYGKYEVNEPTIVEEIDNTSAYENDSIYGY